MTEEEKKLYLDHFDPSDGVFGSGSDYFDGLNNPFEGGSPAPSRAPSTLGQPTNGIEGQPPRQLPQQSDENEGSNRQRLLAYLGMGAQSAISGMTGFKGSSDVYNSMLSEADKNDKLASIKRGQLLNYLKNRDTADASNRRIDALENYQKTTAVAKKEEQGTENVRKDKEYKLKEKESEYKAQELGLKKEEAANKPNPADTRASAKGIEEMGQWYSTGRQSAQVAIKNLNAAIKSLTDNPNLAGNKMFSTMSNSNNEVVKALAKTNFPEQYALQRSITNDALPLLKELLKGAISDNDLKYFLQSRIDLGLPSKEVLQELQTTIDKANSAFATQDGYYGLLRETGSVLGASREQAKRALEPPKEVIPQAQAPKMPTGWGFKEIK